MEIGAGTGYNAALLDVLVGTDGAVTTIDFLPAAVREARETLRHRPRPREGVPRRRRVRPSGTGPYDRPWGPTPSPAPSSDRPPGTASPNSGSTPNRTPTWPSRPTSASPTISGNANPSGGEPRPPHENGPQGGLCAAAPAGRVVFLPGCPAFQTASCSASRI
ncbi:hypothetical protein [Acrocarpospora corrugata]|uniref:hypothetical protein n=1 Tax=Acrocarpospora corrugata TaxID=35763 RepID=UPI0024842CB9